jgi:uncharacterized glyoxalase superfamily protein PhnB
LRKSIPVLRAASWRKNKYDNASPTTASRFSERMDETNSSCNNGDRRYYGQGADIPNAEPMRSAYLTLRLDTPEKAEHIYNVLSSDGEIFMKMEKTFFANRFAMLRDKFGTSWMLLNEN